MSRGAGLTIPNLITLARILMVPVIVWAIASNQMQIAFALFLIAGLSDLIDGFLAKRFGMATELGAYLDPLADTQKQIESAFDDAAKPELPKPDAPSAAETNEAAPLPSVDVPLPEPPPAVSEKDFATAEAPPPKQAGGKA